MQIQPQCFLCRHLAEDGMYCKAFPKGIPDDILYNRVSHTLPFPGDNGVRFEEGGPLSDLTEGTSDSEAPPDS